MNCAMISGRLKWDPTIAYTTGEKPICVARFTVEVPKKRDPSKYDNIKCVSFGEIAEKFERYLRKGDFVSLSGQNTCGSYVKDGRRVYTQEIMVEEIDHAPSMRSGGEAPKTEAAAPPADADVRIGDDQSIPEGFNLLNENDIPF